MLAPVAVFNIAQGWVRDASAEVVHELRRRCDLQLRSIPEALRALTDRYEALRGRAIAVANTNRHLGLPHTP